MKHRLLRSAIITTLFLTGLCPFLEAQADGSATPRSVRLPWPGDDNAWSFEVIVEEEYEGGYREHLREFTDEFFAVVSLTPGKYRYRVIPYDFLGRPETEHSSAWRDFDIPPAAQVIEAAQSSPGEPGPIMPGLDDTIAQEEDGTGVAVSVIQPEYGNQGGLPKPEILIYPPREKKIGDPRLWTAGASVGTSFYRPWFIASIHGTIAPKPYSFLEWGVDLGFSSGETESNYTILYPFVHYALFAPFRTKGGWYIGAGGGLWISTYTFEGETEHDIQFIVDLTTGFNIMNVLDISYTLHTNFNGINHKLSLGFVYRFGVK
jgi:hypothetical protein